MLRRLVTLPLTLLTAAAGLDVLHLLAGLPAAAAWHLITAGLLLGIAVTAAQWLDRIFAESPVRTSDLGVVLVLVLFGVSWVLRLGQPEWQPTWAAVLFGWIGAAGLVGVTAVSRRRRNPAAAQAC